MGLKAKLVQKEQESEQQKERTDTGLSTLAQSAPGAASCQQLPPLLRITSLQEITQGRGEHYAKCDMNDDLSDQFTIFNIIHL